MVKATGRKAVEQIQISTKETTTKTRSMATVSFFGALEVNTKVIMITILKRDMERCIGLMEVYIEVFGLEVFSQALVL